MSAEMKPPSLFIAMPSYGGIEPQFVESLLRLQLHLTRLGVRHEFKLLPGESLITRARNRMVREFLDDTEHTHLLFLDCDLIFDPTTVVRLLTSGFDVVGGAYAKKGIGHGVVGNPDYAKVEMVGDDKATVTLPPVKDGFARAKDVGTGCLLISRAAFDKLKAAKRPDGEPAMMPYTDDMGTGAKVWPFFDCGPEDGRDPESRYLSEDYFWCRLWQVVGGGEVWLDTRSTIKHVGKYAYDAPSIAKQWAEGAK